MTEPDDLYRTLATLVSGQAQLRALLLDFRASVSQALDDMDQRIDGLAREIRAHQQATTVTLTNELAAITGRWDRRYRQVEDHLADLERRTP
jgi:phage shock protein A